MWLLSLEKIEYDNVRNALLSSRLDNNLCTRKER